MYRRFLTLFLAVSAGCGYAAAQGGSQTITIRPGWNAVFLEIQPEPKECATVFSSAPFIANPVPRVAMWTGDELGAQFISDPTQILPSSDGWLMYFTSNAFNASLASSTPTLNVLLGGRAYLIYSTAAGNFDWPISGTPGPRTIHWKADAYNFTGFYLGQATGPTFSTFFAPSLAHAGQPVYRMSTAGAWTQVTSPATDTLARGEAYWVYTKGASDYQGPLRVMSQGSTLDFGKSATEITMSVRNESTVTANNISCTITPQLVAGQPAILPLKYYGPDVSPGTYVWTSVPAGGWTFSLAPQEEKTIRLQIDRTVAPLLNGAASGRLESLLHIVGSGTPLGAGTVAYDVPVFAQTVDATKPRAGLWAGDAVITAVSEHIGTTPRTAPTPVGREFSYHLLVHVDNTGAAKLLQKAVLVWKSPSEPVVLATNSVIKTYQQNLAGQAVPIGRRLSAPAFAFDAPLASTSGSFPLPANTSSLVFTVALAANDSLNPFLHRFHPDHDNLHADNATPYGDADVKRESYAVTRTLTLAFKTVDPEGRSVAGWGDSEVGGTFSETVHGLMRDQRNGVAHDNDIQSSGYFRLRRVSDVGVLDPAY